MSEQNDDFVSFEKALRDLSMQSAELKKLVSEGEIRAFRDGQSMKFKREDIAALGQPDDAEESLVFTDALEDDTGMVTEELTDEETLLAEDDLLEEDEPAPRRPAPVTTPSRRVARVEAEAATTEEPGWVTAAAICGALVGIYGLMVLFNIAADTAPAGPVAWLFGSS